MRTGGFMRVVRRHVSRSPEGNSPGLRLLPRAPCVAPCVRLDVVSGYGGIPSEPRRSGRSFVAQGGPGLRCLLHLLQALGCPIRGPCEVEKCIERGSDEGLECQVCVFSGRPRPLHRLCKARRGPISSGQWSPCRDQVRLFMHYYLS